MLGSPTGSETMSTDGRRESRKRRRLSERRRIFGRLASGDNGSLLMSTSQEQAPRRIPSSPASRLSRDYITTTGDKSSFDYSTKASRQQQQRRSDSPVLVGGDQNKISMKIQFHITVAPNGEPLILDTGDVASLLASQQQHTTSSPPQAGGKSKLESAFSRQRASISSIGEQIHEKLARQSTLSTRRRNQLLAMHNQSALDSTGNNNNNNDKINGVATADDGTKGHKTQSSSFMHSDDNLARLRSPELTTNGGGGGRSGSLVSPFEGDHHVGGKNGTRSSTITGGMPQDEATINFLARHQAAGRLPSPSVSSLGASRHNDHLSGSLATPSGSLNSSSRNLAPNQRGQREHIYFKRDGQRFGHEFTLKLSVDKSYRCLLKVRPLIPLQAITIQGHHVSFVDCSTNPGAQLSSSAPTSMASLNSSLQSIGGGGGGGCGTNLRSTTARSRGNFYNEHSTSLSSANSTATSSSGGAGNGRPPANSNYRHHQLNHAQTTLAISLAERRLSSALNTTTAISPLIDNQLMVTVGGGGGTTSSKQLQQLLLKQQQHNQMTRYFAASHCSPSGSHLGGQLVYMFDWSASRFEVNKNKARTELHTVLKFKNGQILSLPLQVKFYPPESKQHLNWGNQLHFIDYNCNIDNLGQIQVDRVHYY